MKRKSEGTRQQSEIDSRQSMVDDQKLEIETHNKSRVSRHAKLWIGLGILILLVPLGLIIPEVFKAGGAWGEWGTEDIRKMMGYIPEGMKRLSDLWSAPAPEYAFSGWDRGVKGYVAYMISALAGVAAVIGLTCLFARILKRRQK